MPSRGFAALCKMAEMVSLACLSLDDLRALQPCGQVSYDNDALHGLSDERN
jgi:hypothetical protein